MSSVTVDLRQIPMKTRFLSLLVAVRGGARYSAGVRFAAGPLVSGM
jgi:hypothetical protein